MKQTAAGTGHPLAAACTALFSTPEDQDDSSDGDDEYRWEKKDSLLFLSLYKEVHRRESTKKKQEKMKLLPVSPFENTVFYRH